MSEATAEARASEEPSAIRDLNEPSESQPQPHEFDEPKVFQELRDLSDQGNVDRAQPTNVESATFRDVLYEVLAGKKVARLDWSEKDPDAHVMLRGGFLELFTTTPTMTESKVQRPAGYYGYMVSEEDMRATDWVIYW